MRSFCPDRLICRFLHCHLVWHDARQSSIIVARRPTMRARPDQTFPGDECRFAMPSARTSIKNEPGNCRICEDATAVLRSGNPDPGRSCQGFDWPKITPFVCRCDGGEKALGPASAQGWGNEWYESIRRRDGDGQSARLRGVAAISPAVAAAISSPARPPMPFAQGVQHSVRPMGRHLDRRHRFAACGDALARQLRASGFFF